MLTGANVQSEYGCRLPAFGLCLACVLVGVSFSGCGSAAPDYPPALLAVPLAVNGQQVSPALIDTGGGYELMLRQAYGLKITGGAEVLAFGGAEVVSITEGFSFNVNGVPGEAEYALMGLSVCDCNGVGYEFFRNQGLVLEVDLASNTVAFRSAPPYGDAVIPFLPPPATLPDYDTAIIPVTLAAQDEERDVLGVLDTGAARTVIRRGLLPGSGDSLILEITHPSLGTVLLEADLFDTPGLPDAILGLDVMRTWADVWSFDFTADAGAVTVLFEAGTQMPSLDDGAIENADASVEAVQ
jgi:hypothetical protein